MTADQDKEQQHMVSRLYPNNPFITSIHSPFVRDNQNRLIVLNIWKGLPPPPQQQQKWPLPPQQAAATAATTANMVAADPTIHRQRNNNNQQQQPT
jgi:hypothetical protein